MIYIFNKKLFINFFFRKKNKDIHDKFKLLILFSSFLHFHMLKIIHKSRDKELIKKKIGIKKLSLLS